MPCGGIYPIGGVFEDDDLAKEPCWECGKPGADHMLEEWDSVLHGACVDTYLESEEGEIVLHHKHAVIVREENGTKRALTYAKTPEGAWLWLRYFPPFDGKPEAYALETHVSVMSDRVRVSVPFAADGLGELIKILTEFRDEPTPPETTPA